MLDTLAVLSRWVEIMTRGLRKKIKELEELR